MHLFSLRKKVAKNISAIEILSLILQYLDGENSQREDATEGKERKLTTNQRQEYEKEPGSR